METKNKGKEKQGEIKKSSDYDFFPLDMVKETRDIVDASKTYSNRRSRKNKYSGSQKFPTVTRGEKQRNEERSLCNECR